MTPRSRLSVRSLALGSAALALCACSVGSDDGTGTPSDDIGQAQSDVVRCADGATTKGIDVSSYQGTIHWAEVRAAGYRFAIIKATEGTSFVDPKFETNWAHAKGAGVLRGAYHFFRPSVDGVTQAKHFVQVMGQLTDEDLPPVCDLEVQDGVSDHTVIVRVRDFMQTVKELTGRTPMLYTGYFFTSLGDPSGFSGYPLWVANWGVSCPNLPDGGWGTWRFWQHTDHATVPGISGAVDGDKYNGSYSELVAWLEQSDRKATGSFQKANCTSLSGWAWDADTPSKAVTVRIYDGNAQSGTLVAKVTAKKHVEALCTKLGSCNHGFAVALPAKVRDGAEHTLRAYATGNEGGPVPLKGNPKTLTCDPPDGTGGAGGADDSGGADSGGADTGGDDGADSGGAAATDPSDVAAATDPGADADGADDGSGCSVTQGRVAGRSNLGLVALLLGAACTLGRCVRKPARRRNVRAGSASSR